MHIVAVACAPFDIETFCLGTLLKYHEAGGGISLIFVTAKGWTRKDKRSAMRLASSLGITPFVIDKFDHRAVTQDNVKAVETLIRKTRPTVAIIPFPRSTDSYRKIVGSSALTGCRTCQNVLMYEPYTNNDEFVPNVFCTIDKQVTDLKTILIGAEKSALRKAQKIKPSSSAKRDYCKPAIPNRTLEVFQSHRLVLNSRASSDRVV